MSPIRPNPEQFKQLAQAPDKGPVVMLNLLKFRERAADGKGSGAEAYERYGQDALRMVAERGGRVLWQGRADQILIGDPAEDWDAVALVQYPSRKAFMEMVTDPDYLKSHEHRESGLERTVLIACTAMRERTGEGATP
jgi:uncharacterized protein (DUF1330 family)